MGGCRLWARQGVLRSDDAGSTPGIITSLLIEPNNPQIVYAGIAHGGLYKTTSSGE